MRFQANVRNVIIQTAIETRDREVVIVCDANYGPRNSFIRSTT
jgi:hypothetical protein